MPDAVAVTLAELAGSLREGLLALAVGAGFQVDALIDESMTALAGPKFKHDPQRRAVRHGTEAGSVVLGGRRVPVRRP
ncbi:MAG: IS256 family transposase, partial [Actinomycetota bacterium]|nr:IS256 family transposase [Actinomycetota bacterium]